MAQALSRFGDPITLIALASISYAFTGSALYTAFAVLITTLPAAVFGFAAGAIADSLGHRRAMILCDILRVPLIGAVPIVLTAGAPLWVAYVLVFAAGLCGAVFNPARVAIVPALVPPDRLQASNSLVYGTDRTVEIAGALAGGVLVATIGLGAFYVDAATFALSAIFLSRVGVADAVGTRLSWSNVMRETSMGLRFIRDSAVLRANTIFSLIAQLSLPVFNGLLPVLIIRRFADGDAAAGAPLFGLAEAVLAAGAVLASVLLPSYLARVPKGRALIVGFGALGAFLAVAGLAPSFPLLLVIVAVIGVVNVVSFVPNVTIAQEVTPAMLRGRVFGARYALVSLSWLPIVLFAGALADLVDAGTLILLFGLLTLATALVASRIPAIRDVA